MASRQAIDDLLHDERCPFELSFAMFCFMLSQVLLDPIHSLDST